MMETLVLHMDAEGIGTIVKGTVSNGKLRYTVGTRPLAVIVDEKKHILIEQTNPLIPIIKNRIPLYIVDWSKGIPIQLYPKPEGEPQDLNTETIARILDIEILKKLIGKEKIVIDWQKIAIAVVWGLALLWFMTSMKII